MTPSETISTMKSHIEDIYRIQKAAVKVLETYEAYDTADKAHRETSYDFSHQNKEGNEAYFSSWAEYQKQDRLLKRAIKEFFKATNQPEKIRKWDYACEAIWDFNKNLDERLGWGCTPYYKEFSLYSCKIRKY